MQTTPERHWIEKPSFVSIFMKHWASEIFNFWNSKNVIILLYSYITIIIIVHIMILIIFRIISIFVRVYNNCQLRIKHTCSRVTGCRKTQFKHSSIWFYVNWLRGCRAASHYIFVAQFNKNILMKKKTLHQIIFRCLYLFSARIHWASAHWKWK